MSSRWRNRKVFRQGAAFLALDDHHFMTSAGCKPVACTRSIRISLGLPGVTDPEKRRKSLQPQPGGVGHTELSSRTAVYALAGGDFLSQPRFQAMRLKPSSPELARIILPTRTIVLGSGTATAAEVE